MYWSSSSGRIALQITKQQAALGSHQGQCDQDIAELRTVPAIHRQLAKLSAEEVRNELREYGAWDDDELTDHNDNLNRLLWLACGDITEGNN